MDLRFGFINFIRIHHGEPITNLIKSYMNINSKIASFISRKIFLIRCRRYGIFPKHIINNINCLFINLEHNMPFNNKMKKMEENFKRSILNIEIKTTFWKITSLNKSISAIKLQLDSSILDKNILEDFYTRQLQVFKNLLNSHLITVNKKFDNLKIQQYRKYNICNNEWCYNISGTIVPDNVIKTVGLGPKFGLPFFKIKDIPTYKILAEAESIIQRINNFHDQDIARFQISNCIYNFLNHNFHLSSKERFIQNLFFETKNFLVNNPNIIALKSDKGNCSVIMNKSDYDERINSLINEPSTYQIINKDPTLSLQNKNNEFIRSFQNSNYIDENTKRSLTTYNSVAPKFYGLPKVHKENYPLRPIVSFIKAPTYNTSKYLANILKHVITDTYNIKNSYDFVEFIKVQQIPDDFVLISLDVVSLFTNIKIDLALDIIDTKFDLLQNYTDIPKPDFLNCLSFCLKSGYFVINNRYYKQIDGIAMGSPLSPIIANIVMENLLDTVTSLIDFSIHFIKIYVDDLLLCIPKDKVEGILSIFNNNIFGLKFTLELENNYQIPFLDTLLTRKSNGQILTSWYTKSCSSGRILNYHSIHPQNQIINTAFGFIYRVMKLTTDESFDTESFIIRYLTANKFPKFLINKLISRYKQIHHNTPTISNPSNILNPTNVQYRSICYVKGLSTNLANILNKFDINCKIIFYVSNTLKQLFSKLKDETPKLLNSNVIYKIPCQHCNLIYIGTTSQLLKKRLSGHKSDVKPPIRNQNVTSLCLHTHNTGHHFKFDNVEILDVENKYFNRLFLEMVYISAHHGLAVNKRHDTNDLSSIYSGIINYISNL